MSSKSPLISEVDELVIDARGVSKCYQIYDRPSHRLVQSFLGDSKRLYREFWALRGVDLQVRRGETLGIIGKNGSGKSTLLQMIAGTLSPSEGEVEVQGRIAALLELGSGFNPDFTGRENVFLNASILGLSNAQIEARLQEILDFADIGAFIDQPIRNYSSGMVMRLAFSVMAHVDADVLIIDEALAVGDAFFTQKCMRFLREFKARGTLLFVSHDDSAVSGLCDSAIWLDEGTVRSRGSARDVVHDYLESFISQRQSGESVRASTVSHTPVRRAPLHDARRQWINSGIFRNDIEIVPFDPAADGFGALKARVIDVTLEDHAGRTLSWCIGGESVVLQIDVVADEHVAEPIVGFYLKDRLGQQLFGDNTCLSAIDDPKPLAPGEGLRASFVFEMPRLRAGDYFFTIGVSDGNKEVHVVQHWIHEALPLKSQAEEWASGLIGLPMLDIKVEYL